MTKIYIDTANLNEIREIIDWNIIKGVTTNQKIMLNEKGCNFKMRINDILKLVYPKPVHVELSNTFVDAIYQAIEFNSWGDNIVIKVPMLGNGDGLRLIGRLSEKGIKTNATVCMTTNQAYMALNAGATYISMFYNRMKDMKDRSYALETISDVMDLSKDFDTQIIVGSIRSPDDITNILLAKPHIITIPTHILKQLPYCKATEDTLDEFQKAWVEFKKHEIL